ncbi:MAG: VTT domain-containing protein [Clostridia bacterium]|nr:VTT domain-containing protein [Clostridia bacterium]
MATDKNQAQQYGKLVKILQIVSFAFMLAMLVLCVVFLVKNHISVKNADSLKEYLPGGAVAIALVLIGFSVVKSFALVFPPAVLFVLSGMVFESFWAAVLVNVIATAASLILPYFLGRFTGKAMVDSLKGRFKAIQKLDDFADANSFAVVFVFKAGGFMPSDLSSLIFGAMGIPFRVYFTAANLGMLVLNVLWTLLGSKGDVSNPLSYLYVLPALLFAVAASVFMSKRKQKKQQALQGHLTEEPMKNDTTETEDEDIETV